MFAGGAAGALLATARDERSERRANVTIAVAGAALVALGFYTAGRPSIYAAASFWTSSPTWLAIRTGILMLALSWLYGLERLVGRRDTTNTQRLNGFFRAFALSWQVPLERLGQHSLFIYWIHVELVYGYSSWLWRQRLPLWATAIGYVLERAPPRRAHFGAVRLVPSDQGARRLRSGVLAASLQGALRLRSKVLRNFDRGDVESRRREDRRTLPNQPTRPTRPTRPRVLLFEEDV